MHQYNIDRISDILQASFLQTAQQFQIIEHLQIDSRRIIHPQTSLFFALQTNRRDGHSFIQECYHKGIRNFVVQQTVNIKELPEANILLVDNTLSALQKLAAFHRQQFNIPVIGITGSNGKTIVKEWLHQLLSDQYSIVRSPKSYNSQVGVPLSVWGMNEQHTLAIFEAGISQHDEMVYLQQIIQPTIGVLTNIGEAHDEGFNNKKEKLNEKLKLFQNSKVVICNPAQLNGLQLPAMHLFTHGSNKTNQIEILSIHQQLTSTTIQFNYQQQIESITISFIDDASIDNVLTCLSVCLYLQVPFNQLKDKFAQLRPISLRLELKKGYHQTTLINDSYSADLSSFAIALQLLEQQKQHAKKTLILSDFPVSEQEEMASYESIAKLISSHHISRLITVGEKSKVYLGKLLPHSIQQIHFLSTEELITQLSIIPFQDEAILVKGARRFGLDKVAAALEQKTHQTVLEINLTAITKNIREYQKLLRPSTKIMAMVKAFSYGSGSYEIANLLQFLKIDYLAVAFADEGVDLRRAGITLPIMVMNPEPSTFDALIDYNLEPELFSFSILEAFASFLEKEAVIDYPVHLKIDTGMHRLGFMPTEIPALCSQLKLNNHFSIQSVFSHLAASEDPQEDPFTLQQARLFEEACQLIETTIGYSFIQHIDNSNGTLRHPQLQYDMVRLGIGMYGISSATSTLQLEEALTLKTTIAQIKQLNPGETVGYNRKGQITQPSTIATVRVGYADGYLRELGNGRAYMLFNGQKAPVIGTVCMDMTMIDITGLQDIHEGDEVIVFGKELPLTQLAKWGQTIPYELMTGISQRVKRVYFEE